MSRVVNVKPIGSYSDDFRIFALAESLTSGATKMFSFVGAMPDKSLSINMNPILGKDKTVNNVFISNGRFGASTTAEQNVSEADFSFSLNKDFNTEINLLDPRVCKDVLQAIISGEKFTNDNEEWVVVGINGQRNIGGLSTTDMKYFFLEEGKLAIPNEWDENGEKLTQENGVVAPFADTALVGFEMTGLFGTDTRRGYRIPYAFETEKMFNQDTTADNYSTTMKRLCDVIQTAGSIYDVMTDAQPLSLGNISVVSGDAVANVTAGQHTLEGVVEDLTTKGLLVGNRVKISNVAGDFVIGIIESFTAHTLTLVKPFTESFDGSVSAVDIDNLSNVEVAKRIEADYVIEVAGGTAPTLTGVNGEQAVVINTTNGTIELYVYDGSWKASTTGVTIGTLIRGSKYGTALDTVTSKVTLVACKTLSGVAVMVGNNKYALELMDMSYAEAKFVNYEG